ncbi:biotin-independent malonate decarboxylase subunit beta [Granulicella arctica]|uniref:Malonate decarboxylase beta subunit n=1 Tax=Granulicella arctica TaxID=940613 RepID=A0A7Y9PH05_9BACT|nr:malonate decarboxylase beta subunit [Granulicella arctica]
MTEAPFGCTATFQELSARERISALLDGGYFRELVGPFDRVSSPWLEPQGLVPQSDDGVVVGRGKVSGREIVAIAIEPAFEGGSVGEVGGAKIATALELAQESCRAGTPIAALLLLETGGVRLQEANLGLASIARIQAAIVSLRELAPVIAVVAGPTGCFGGMSLAAALCTWIIGTPHGRLGMNGPEVIEQEAGPTELDASDRELIWKLIGCETRYFQGVIDAFVEDNASSIACAIADAVARGVLESGRLENPELRLDTLRRNHMLGKVSEAGNAAIEERSA